MKRVYSNRLARPAVLVLILGTVFGTLAIGAQSGARPSMELLETKQNASQSALEINGQVKNISPRAVSGVTVYCDFQDGAGKSVKREQGRLDTDPLAPNKISTFKISTPYNTAIKRFNVTFGQIFGGPLTTKDSRKP